MKIDFHCKYESNNNNNNDNNNKTNKDKNKDKDKDNNNKNQKKEVGSEALAISTSHFSENCKGRINVANQLVIAAQSQHCMRSSGTKDTFASADRRIHTRQPPRA